jgi:hypothetical protein
MNAAPMDSARYLLITLDQRIPPLAYNCWPVNQ